MAISKKMRFEIFKRDGFRCVYCGGVPPIVVLQIDHIEPQSKGGCDDINNLVTACADCNQGKSNRDMGRMPAKLVDNLVSLKEKNEQYAKYKKYIKKLADHFEAQRQEIKDHFSKLVPGRELSEQFIASSVDRFLKALSVEELKNDLVIAFGHFPDDPQRMLRYFCGICWRQIKKDNRGGVFHE